jgi:cell division protein FtsL
MYCTACGQEAPNDATFCPACGLRLHGTTTAALSNRAENNAYVKPLLWAVAAAAAVTVILIGFVVASQREQARQRNAALSQARATHDQLSRELNDLQTVESNLESEHATIKQENAILLSDTASASEAGNERHDEGLGESDIVKMHDLAQREVQLISDALSQQAAVESGDSALLSYWNNLYGDAVIKQYRADVAARNEARDNSLAEWDRAIGLINDNLTQDLHDRSTMNANSDIIAHYTESTRDANESNRYSKLVDADAQVLQVRLGNDISSVRSKLTQLKGQYPNLFNQKVR